MCQFSSQSVHSLPRFEKGGPKWPPPVDSSDKNNPVGLGLKYYLYTDYWSKWYFFVILSKVYHITLYKYLQQNIKRVIIVCCSVCLESHNKNHTISEYNCALLNNTFFPIFCKITRNWTISLQMEVTWKPEPLLPYYYPPAPFLYKLTSFFFNKRSLLPETLTTPGLCW